MNGGTNIPVPPENGDSEVETGLVVQQKVGQIDYTKESIETLIAQIYKQKRGKVDLNLGYGMYIELPPGGKIDLNQFAAEYLLELISNSRDARTFLWSKDFGRVAVGISDRKSSNKKLCTFASKDDADAKSFKLISGTRNVNPRDFIFQNSQESGSNLIVLNDQTTSIDGLFITLTHMIDELVWDRARLISGSDFNLNQRAYITALELIMQEGITLQFADTQCILNNYIECPELSVRIYGSGNPSVPKVMGYVVNNAFSKTFGLQNFNQVKFIEAVPAEKIPVDNYEVVIGITTAKQIHVGHLFLYLIANSIAKPFGTAVTIMANNTGPRVAQTVIALRDQLLAQGIDITLEECQSILSKMSLSDVEAVYRNRSSETSEEELEQVTTDLLSCIDNPVLKTATEENLAALKSIGLNPNLVFDSDTDPLNSLQNSFENTTGYNPELGIGFSSLASGQSAVFMEKGIPTATGIVLSNIIYAANNSEGINGVAYIDQGLSTVLGCKITDENLGIPAFQANGAAIGFGGEIASGTKGNSITISEFKFIIDQIGNQLDIPVCDVNEIVLNALSFKLFDTVFISTKHPNDASADTFYDFADKKSFCKFLRESTLNYISLQNNLDNISDYLEGGGNFINQNGISKISKNELLGKASGILSMKNETLLKKIKQQTVIPARRVEESMFMSKGYDAESAQKFMQKVKSEKLFVVYRPNPYVDFALVLNQLNKSDLDQLNNQERNFVQQSILIIKKVI